MEKNTKYIYHHLGLGDHIVCHGIVRYYCEIEENVTLFVKPHNYENVKYMFNDLINLELIKLIDDNTVNEFINANNIKNVLKVGWGAGGDNGICRWENVEEDFYLMAGLPVNYKTEKFYINRNLEKEIELFNSLKLIKNEYIFVHDGDTTNNNTGLKYIPDNYQIIKPNTHGIFDWMYIIENAKEIHCIDSSFICLVDCMNTNNIPLFNHRYIKGYPNNIKIFTKKNWTFYEN